MRSRPFWFLPLLPVLLSLCACQPRGLSAPPPVPVSWEEAADATYSGPMGLTFEMENGEWTGEPYVEGGAAAPRAGLADDFLLLGDLDGDGVEESVVLVWTSTGGSGTFDYLAVVERLPDGAVAERASVELGDRVHVRTAAIADGRIVLDTVQAGAGDAMCCPGQLLRRTFTLENGRMTERSTEDRGRLSVDDLDGEWMLRRIDREPVPENVRITARFEAGRLSGTAACNPYNGRIEAGDAPGDIRLAGPLAVTRKLCPPPLMEWERRYLQALQGLSKFSFTAGQLVLIRGDETGVGSLRFEAADFAADATADE